MRNIVLITVDCLRADHMGCYNYRRNTSPYLDDIANKGIFFKNAYANGPNTRHSVPSFLTSTYPLLFLQEVKSDRLHKGRKTIAEILKKRGYTTLAIHSNPYISKFYGYDKGFDYFNDFLSGQVEDEKKVNIIHRIISETIKGIKALTTGNLPHEKGEEINKQVFQWIKNIQTPFFLWIHYMDVHMPYVPHNRFLKEIGVKNYSNIRKVWMGKKIDDIKMRDKIKDKEIKDYINLYDGCIRYIDMVIKKLITKLEKDFENTIFIITADHGEEFREHGQLSHLEKLYNELLHIPLIFYGKDIDKKTVEKPVSLISMAPTLLDLLGFKKYELFQGKTFFDSEEYIISEAWKEGRITAYTDKETKLILKKGKNELYDLKKDPFEKQNVFNKKEYKSKLKKPKEILEKHIADIKKEREKRKTMIQKAQIKKSLRRVKKG